MSKPSDFTDTSDVALAVQLDCLRRMTPQEPSTDSEFGTTSAAASPTGTRVAIATPASPRRGAENDKLQPIRSTRKCLALVAGRWAGSRAGGRYRGEHGMNRTEDQPLAPRSADGTDRYALSRLMEPTARAGSADGTRRPLCGRDRLMEPKDPLAPEPADRTEPLAR
jgi:hypothetical protein